MRLASETYGQPTSGGARAANASISDAVSECIASPRQPVALFQMEGGQLLPNLWTGRPDDQAVSQDASLIGMLPPLYPEYLGSGEFTRLHGCRFAYITGEMARGIATSQMVTDAARAGLVGFFGSAGLPLQEIEASIKAINAVLPADARNWGANLIHTPDDPEAEMAFAQMMLRLRVPLVSASAFMRLSPAIVLLAAKGLARQADGTIARPTRLFAKVSRAEVARQFLSPAPEAIIRKLVEAGHLSEGEAALAQAVPVAEDLTAEADSGGHTDNRSLSVLLPQMIDLANELTSAYGYSTRPRVGAAGGLGTPAAVAMAFAAGADYVVTGSINQCTVQSGLSADARAMLAEAEATDISMAPAADMFELGVKVQVLKRGTLFTQRGQKLYEAYRRYRSFDDMPAAEIADLEKTVLGRKVDDIWQSTAAHFARANPAHLARAERDPHFKMALVFRWYLFMGAQWAREGNTERRSDYQIWCGAAMGGFNQWVRGSFLEPAENRDCVQIALNLMEGAAHISRAHQLRLAGVAVPVHCYSFSPRPLC